VPQLTVSKAANLWSSEQAVGWCGAQQQLRLGVGRAGFDVWMANQRGNTYSRRNVNSLFPYQPEFWYFSIDTLAQLDLPTQVDYVLQTTGASKIAYLGHSQVRCCVVCCMECAWLAW
jgi:pimeloyl-ACP methyl ester carboxylesterase